MHLGPPAGFYRPCNVHAQSCTSNKTTDWNWSYQTSGKIPHTYICSQGNVVRPTEIGLTWSFRSSLVQYRVQCIHTLHWCGGWTTKAKSRPYFWMHILLCTRICLGLQGQSILSNVFARTLHGRVTPKNHGKTHFLGQSVYRLPTNFFEDDRMIYYNTGYRMVLHL